jgi:hypothetical protein
VPGIDGVDGAGCAGLAATSAAQLQVEFCSLESVGLMASGLERWGGGIYLTVGQSMTLCDALGTRSVGK